MTSSPRPNLFIIGAMKAGTTSLHDYLREHPSIFMSEPKEPGFFVPELKEYPRDEAWYLSLFAEAGDATWVGESSTHYTKLPLYQGVAQRIRDYSPDAKLIYIMRDPVDRSMSHYWHRVNKREEWRDLMSALRADNQYVSFSDYRMQLEPYFDLFGRDRVLTLSFERMLSNPEATSQRCFDWLGLEPAGPREFPRANVRPEQTYRLRGRGLLHRFSHSSLWSRLSPLVPARVKRMGRGLAEGQVDPASESVEEARAYLHEKLHPRVVDLEQWLGEKFPEWSTAKG
jgi:hypothetical protein